MGRQSSSGARRTPGYHLDRPRRLELRGVRAHRLHSALTMLGLIIGVSAVILLVALGDGMQRTVDARIEPLVNLISVVPTSGYLPGGGLPKNLTNGDVAALQAAPGVAAVTPVLTQSELIQTKIDHSIALSQANVVGSTAYWFDVNNRSVQAGSFFDSADSDAHVVVLGPTVVTDLFGGNPRAAVGSTVQATSAATVNSVLDARRHIHDPADRDFQIQTFAATLTRLTQVLHILTLFIAAVAAISLLVEAVGVLNILLVSVTE